MMLHPQCVVRVRQDDLREDADDAVGGADVDFPVPGPGAGAGEDEVDDVVGGVGEEAQDLGFVGEGALDEAEEVQIAGAAMEPVVAGARVGDDVEVVA